MSKQRIKPLIITGIHRSGTTWLGKLLEMSEETHVYYEPFNPLEKHYPVRVKFTQHWFHYLSDKDFERHRAEIEYGLQLQYSGSVLWKQLGYLKNFTHVMMLLAHLKSYFINRVYHNKRPVIKDPMLVFSIEQLSKFYSLDVLITIRHPAAFVASVKRMHEQQSWGISFKDWIFDQPYFPKSIYQDYKKEMEQAERLSLVEKAALFWKLVYGYLAGLRQRHSSFLYLRHEDLSLNPVNMVKEIYDNFNLNFTATIQQEVERMTGGGNPTEADEGETHTFYRNSSGNLNNWKHKLSEHEKQRVYDITKEVAQLYYAEKEW